MIPNESPRGVILDMDGVLCDSEPFITEAAVRMFRERYGAEVRHADFLPFTGMGEDRFLGGVAGLHGLTLDIEADKRRTYAIYLDLIRNRLQPLPGVAGFLAGCRRRGLQLAVASSADRVKVEGNLAELGFDAAWFDAVIDGNQVARKKPAPDLFLMAAERLHLAPAACVVFEDAVSGIRAAAAAGMRAVAVRGAFDATALRQAGAAAVIGSLTEGLAALGLARSC